jgi:hypothetical protein
MNEKPCRLRLDRERFLVEKLLDGRRSKGNNAPGKTAVTNIDILHVEHVATSKRNEMAIQHVFNKNRWCGL